MLIPAQDIAQPVKKAGISAVLLFLFSSFFAQTSTVTDSICKKDSVCLKDSLRFYKNLHDLAAKHKLTYLVYGAVFRNPPQDAPVAPGQPVIINNKKYFKTYQGKTIRTIRVLTLDPLGKVLNDTILLPRNALEDAANVFHIKTKAFVVRNQLLFKTGEKLDSLKLIESERLIRQSPGIRDAMVTPACPVSGNDSVDVLVVTKDQWSVTGGAGLSTATNSFQLGENNFLGLSHIIQDQVTFNPNVANSFVSTGNYLVSNYRHTFISANTYYTWSPQTKILGMTLDREFVTPTIKWAGGTGMVLVNTQWFAMINNRLFTSPLSYRQEDTWLGRSYQLHKDQFRPYKDTRVVLAGRVADTQYLKRPSFADDSLRRNQGSTLYLASLSFTSRDYYKDVNVYRFGRIEDVPEGRLFTLLAGYQKNEFYEQYYYGARFAAGKHIKHLGNLSGKAEAGAFLRQGLAHEGVINAEIDFLSDLLVIRKWSVREFLNLHATNGINRDAGESINLGGATGLNGFNSTLVNGTNKLVMNISTVVYTPYHLLGFRFAAVLFAGLGCVGTGLASPSYGTLYQTYGLGLLIRNENLIINTIQLSVNYYPIVPGRTSNNLVFSPSIQAAPAFGNFSVTKPDVIGYQ